MGYLGIYIYFFFYKNDYKTELGYTVFRKH